MSNHFPSPAPGHRARFLEELPFQVAALALGFQNLIRRLGREAGLADHMALGMGGIYFALLERDGCRMKDLGDLLAMPKGTLSGLLTRMEQLGLVERNGCPEDGRARRVRLTAKARRQEPALRRRHRRALAILQAGLAKPELARLQKSLAKILKNLRAADHRTPPA